MQRHWKRPWISLLVLAAVAGSLLAWPAPASRAQTTTYPGQTDPLGKRAGALTQFPDDELITVSDAIGGSAYQIAESSPTPDYTFPASPAFSDPLDNPPSQGLPTAFGGYQHVSVTAKGRIVVPNRDVALALTKTTYNATTATISWALQELSFGGSVPSAPASVPPLTWSTPGVQGQPFASTTPGALAVGDLDRVMTPHGTGDDATDATYNDEAVVAYEVRDSTNPNNAQVKLDVVSYVAQPGTATVVATTTTAFSNLSYAYVCSSGSISRGACDVLHPGNINVATGDLDGDGYQDIVLFAMLYHSTDNTVNQLAYVYTYCPAQLAQDDPRVASGACPAGAAGTSLVVKGGGALVNGTLANDPVNGALFHSPAELTVADVDGDGVQELAVLHQVNALYGRGGLGTYDQYLANVMLSLLQWSATSNALHVVWSQPQPTMPITNTWTDAGGTDGAGIYYDMHMAAGLFKFSPQLGYDLNRRQLAVAWTNWLPNNDDSAQPTLAIELWDLASPNSPGPNPPSQWTLSRYSAQQAGLCNNQYTQNYASFALVAGNWAGVKANPASPLWGVGLAFEYATGAFDSPEIVTQQYRVDQNIDPTTANGPLTLASMQTLQANNGGAGSCGSTGRVELVALDFDGDALTLGPPLHSVVSVPQVFDSILQEPPQHLDYFPFGDGMVNVSRRSDFNVGYGDSTGKSFSTSTSTTSDWNVGTSVKANATFGVDGDYLIAKANLSASVTNQFNYDYSNNKNDYTGASDSYTATLTTQTDGGDSVRFRAKTFDIWRYPAYGVASPNPGQPNAYYELLLPRPYLDPDVTMDGLTAQAYGYQPIHENGNILSYPAVAASKTLQPADAGQWLLPADIDPTKLPTGAVLCQNGTRYCLSDPLTNTDQQFYYGATNNTLALAVEQGNTSGGGRSWNNKLSDSLDVEASSQFEAFGVGASGCVNAEVHGGYSWGAVVDLDQRQRRNAVADAEHPGQQQREPGVSFQSGDVHHRRRHDQGGPRRRHRQPKPARNVLDGQLSQFRPRAQPAAQVLPDQQPGPHEPLGSRQELDGSPADARFLGAQRHAQPAGQLRCGRRREVRPAGAAGRARVQLQRRHSGASRPVASQLRPRARRPGEQLPRHRPAHHLYHDHQYAGDRVPRAAGHERQRAAQLHLAALPARHQQAAGDPHGPIVADLPGVGGAEPAGSGRHRERDARLAPAERGVDAGKESGARRDDRDRHPERRRHGGRYRLLPVQRHQRRHRHRADGRAQCEHHAQELRRLGDRAGYRHAAPVGGGVNGYRRTAGRHRAPRGVGRRRAGVLFRAGSGPVQYAAGDGEQPGIRPEQRGLGLADGERAPDAGADAGRRRRVRPVERLQRRAGAGYPAAPRRAHAYAGQHAHGRQHGSGPGGRPRADPRDGARRHELGRL